MTTKHLFPTLDTDGWVETPVKAADYMLSHFFLSEYSQTAHFPGDVSSFSYIVSRFQNDVTAIVAETRRALSLYFSQQFESVEIEVGQQVREDSINIIDLTLFMTFRDQKGEEYNIARMIKYNGLKVAEIIAVINQ